MSVNKINVSLKMFAPYKGFIFGVRKVFTNIILQLSQVAVSCSSLVFASVPGYTLQEFAVYSFYQKKDQYQKPHKKEKSLYLLYITKVSK